MAEITSVHTCCSPPARSYCFCFRFSFFGGGSFVCICVLMSVCWSHDEECLIRPRQRRRRRRRVTPKGQRRSIGKDTPHHQHHPAHHLLHMCADTRTRLHFQRRSSHRQISLLINETHPMDTRRKTHKHSERPLTALFLAPPH